MKKYFIFLLLLFSLSVFGQENPQLSFQKQTIDLGEITIDNKNNIIKVNFIFYNNGNKPLVIYKVTASCHCTTPTWPKAPFPTNKKGIIEIAFDSKGQKGAFSKNLFVESNAEKPITLIKIKGIIK